MMYIVSRCCIFLDYVCFNFELTSLIGCYELEKSWKNIREL